MVAHTGNSTVTTTTNTTLPTANYLSPTFKMNLPQNLLHPIDSWTKNDVQKWIEYCIEEYSLGDVNRSDFEMNGKALLLLNEDSFKQRSSRSGDILHKALQQHRAMLKSWHCQPFPYQLWNNFPFPTASSSTARRFNIPPPPPPPLPISSFHSNAAGVLSHPAAAAAAACMHPAFNYIFNRPDIISKPSSINHQSSYFHSLQQQSTQRRGISPSSTSSSPSSASSSRCPDAESVKISPKSDILHPVHESMGVKREAISPSIQQTNRQPTPTSSPMTTIKTTINTPIKQECMDDEDVDIEQHETVSTPPLASNSPSSSPQSSSSCLSKLNHLNNETIPYKIRSQLLSRIKQQPNDVTNTNENNDDLNRNNLTHDNTRQIRYYHDRIDFRGDILMKPPAAKNCRILWEFLYILLEDPHYESIIHWENREKMIFRIIQADKLAALWGLQKNRLSMTYEKLSRGMRYYYSNNIISKEQSKRLLYRFMRSPDEIRKSMKRNGGTTNMIYSSLNKKTALSYQSTTNTDDQETNVKYNADNDDNSSSSSHFTNSTTSSQMKHQLLQLFSIYSPTATSMASGINPAAPYLYATRNATNNSSTSSASTFNTKSIPLLTTISKSDRSNSSSPESFDSNRDRTSDSEKQHCSPSQSLSSSTSTSSYSTSTKRKQAVPLSLTARLSYQNHHVDQPLNLAVNKEEDTISDCKKQKVISSPSIA
ncbi:unnamed protein product [Adineta steineri]|uniref:ETS domain-containing protein n=2 Tax=Adineta steineri TaxID=433720 RepID=A0A813MJQ2_9BILA|nr:unnamed protein product [Adineta steineri]CAF3479819.1 unnamed protein product [Adineta steineri]